MGTQNNNNRYHHYIPQFYLKGFVNQSGRLAVLNKKNPTKPLIRFEAIKKILGDNHFFGIDGIEEFLQQEKPTKNNKLFTALNIDMLENVLEKGEYIVAPIIATIIKNKKLDIRNIDDLIQWIAWIYIANPTTKKILEQRDPSGSNASRCGGLISWYKKVEPFFHAKTWGLAISSRPLITTDRPVVLTEQPILPKDVMTINKATVFFPINPEILLVGIPNKENCLLFPEESMKLTEHDSFYIESLLFNNADELVLAKEKEHLMLCSKIINSK